VAEADSLIDLIDDQTLEIRLLQIDLEELQKMARIDSILAENHIQLLQAERQSFLSRALSYPALWFILGAWAGLQVSR
jgi:hypothetical protein